MSEDRFASPKPKKPPTRPPKRNILSNLTIRVLRGIIDQLEGIVTQLENPSFPEKSRNREQRKRSLGYQLSRILSPIRLILPNSLNRILPDPILAIAVGAILIIILSQIIKQFPSREPPSELAQTNPSEPTPAEIIIEKPLEEIPTEPPALEPEIERGEPFPPELVTETPAISEEIKSVSEDDIKPLPPVESENRLEPENLAENPDKIPLFLVATAPPEPINLISPPSLQLTPEQYLITTIIAKMRESTAKINPEIILSVQTNFPASLLRVELSETWYELSENQQNQIAEILYNQAQNFDFTRMELLETSGKPIARSAVIGSNIIILNRTKSAS